MPVTDTKPALEHLNRLREHVDGDVAEYVDTIAQLVLLEQDIDRPMLGAKVTLYLRPPHRDYSDAEIVDPENAPDPQSDEWNWQWSQLAKEPDDEFRFQPKENPDDPDLVEHEAIVIEGNVAGNAPDGQLYDPNEGEYRTRDEYPLGTINCVVAQDYSSDDVPESLITFSEGYATDVEVFTSITPAKDDPRPHTYTPGWPDG